MPAHSAVVLVVDRLSAGSLGPYGNTWIETPNFNRLASESLLFEWALSDSPDLKEVYRSYWSGQHAMHCGDRVGLLSAMNAHGVESTLLTDAALVAQQPLAGEFHDRVILESRAAECAATDIDETQLAQLFAAVIEWLERAADPFLLWVHAQGMGGAWDAPLDLRRQFVDEGDPDPPEFVDPPNECLADDVDPDRVLGIAHAYAGQVTLLDYCLGAFLDAWDALAAPDTPLANETALLVTSPRGYPTGEHGRVGPSGHALYGELLHVPWLMRLPQQRGAAVRGQSFVQPADLGVTVLKWCGASLGDTLVWGQDTLPMVDETPLPWRDRAGAAGVDQRAFRTPAWYLRESGAAPESHCELYAKPDDRNEVNQVADRCHEVSEQMVEALDAFQQAASAGQPDQLPPLPESLVEGFE